MPLTKDTALITTYYSVLNEMILRVPNTKLDTTLKEIALLVDFMDYRVIDAQDVTLNLLAKRLEQMRLARYDKRMSNAINSKGKKLDDITDAEDNLLYKQQQADEAKLDNLTKLDKIKFSTITISLYQKQSIKYDRVERAKEVKPYSEPFSTRFCNALSFGWKIIVEIVLFLANLWAIILFGIIIWLSIIYIKKRYDKTKNN
jgi:ABC-type phosphate transport system auxiliary subunit